MTTELKQSRLEKLWNLVDKELELMHLLPSEMLNGVSSGVGNLCKLPCPFCKKGKDAFILNNEKNVFYCTACTAGGSSLNFYAKLHDLSMDDALIEIIKNYFLWPKE